MQVPFGFWVKNTESNARLRLRRRLALLSAFLTQNPKGTCIATLQVLRIVSRLTCILSCISLVYYFFYTWGTCIEISRDLHWNLRLFSKTLATCHSQLLQNIAEARNRTRADWTRGKCADHSAMEIWYKWGIKFFK